VTLTTTDIAQMRRRALEQQRWHAAHIIPPCPASCQIADDLAADLLCLLDLLAERESPE